MGELGAFVTGIAREQGVVTTVSWLMDNSPGFASGGFRFNIIYKIRILVVLPRD